MELVRKVSSSPSLLLLLCLMSTPPPAVGLCDCELKLPGGHTMKCSGCSEHDLPQTLRSGVARLVLTGNQLKRLTAPPGSESALGRLTVISADKNEVRELREGDTCSFTMLRVLDLSHNTLKIVDGQSIACNHHLKRLVLSDNQDIQLGDMKSDSLTHLFLDRCNLRNLDKMKLVGLSALKYLYIRGNHMLDCAATARELHELMPQLFIHCDSSMATNKLKTTNGVSSNSTTSASPKISRNSNNIPDRPIQDTHSSPQPHLSFDIYQIVAIAVSAFVCLILLVFILFVIFLLHVKCKNEIEIGTANGKLLRDPC